MRAPIPESLIIVLIVCLGWLKTAQAVSPPPDGGYPNFTTAEGQNALKDLTTGAGNTALGAYSMFSTTTGSFNTAVGAGALDLNTGDQNTAVGVAALLLNTGTNNTAVGVDALGLNTTGQDNAAVGAFALQNNTTGVANTANGFQALYSNTTGYENTADGYQALLNNTGAGNTAVGYLAGQYLTTGDDNIDIGADGEGGDAGIIRIGRSFINATYIAGIFEKTNLLGIAVYIDQYGKLATSTSSARFKDEIKPMDKASEALYALKPVAFRYKKEIDPARIRQLGLVAEEVEKVNPDLIVRDKEGKPYSVRYDQVNAMLLNEFLKEHQTVQELKKQVAELTAGLQKVTAQLEVSKSAPQTVLDNQ